MRKLQEYHSVDTLQRALGFTYVRLSSRAPLQTLAVEVDQQRTTVKAAAEAFSKVQEQRTAATAEIVWRDDQLDRSVIGLSRALLARLDGDRKAPLYQGLFPRAPSTLMAGQADDKQNRFVRALLGTLTTDAQYADFRTRTEAIAASADAVDDAIRARDVLYVQEAQALAKLNQVAAAARRFYNQLYPRLQLIEEDDTLVESYFENPDRSTRGGGSSGSGTPGGSEPGPS